MRTGVGFDAHALVHGRKLILGGVEIPFDKGLEGYSDADVLVHAVMDAILGAAGLRDIGHQFPTGDPAYWDISSISLLKQVRRLVESRSLVVKNIDSVLIAQEPKIQSYIGQMIHNIADALVIQDEQVMVKATTTDGLGSTGRGEGIAAYAVTLLEE